MSPSSLSPAHSAVYWSRDALVAVRGRSASPTLRAPAHHGSPSPRGQNLVARFGSSGMAALLLTLAFALAPVAAHAADAPPAVSPVNPPVAPAVAAAPIPADEPDEFATPPISDPFEPVNRTILKFNDGFYTYVLRPVAHGYERATPPPVQHGIANFFTNLKFPIRFVGDVLAGRPKRAAQETGKFLINSTAGFAGLINVTDSMPALKDVPPGGLGTAFASWGLGHGPFLVLPVLGPSSVRDGVGLVGDIYLIPTNWTWFERLDNYDWTWRTGLQTFDVIQSAPDWLKNYDEFKKASLDPYIAVRNGYIQYRAAAVKK